MGWRGPTGGTGGTFNQGALRVDDREALRALQQLEKLTRKRVATKVLRRAGAPIRADAKLRVPVKSGRLQRSIKVYVSVKKYSATGKVESREPYAHLVELGTKPHFQNRKLRGETKKRRVKHPGAQAKPFLRPAFDANKTESIEIARRTLAEELRTVTKG